MLDHKEWKGNTGGKPWMQRFLVFWFRYVPLSIPYFCMAWIVPFYMVGNRTGYLSIYRYFRKRQKYSVLKSFWMVYLNHYRFGQIIIDRFAMYAGKSFRVTIEGQELFDALDSQSEGFVILSSHIGNYELAGYSLIPQNKSFNVLIYDGETQQVMKGRHLMFDEKKIQMIPVNSDMSHIFQINRALSEGNIVSIPGDRVFGSSKTVPVHFLGDIAHFPKGPFAIAIQRSVGLLAVFVLKESCSSYRVNVKAVSQPEETNRMNHASTIAQLFAGHIEEILHQYPEQWFNYYNFWKK